MPRMISRLLFISLLFLMSVLLFSCAAPTQEPSPPPVLSATDVVPTLGATATIPPSPIPPTPTPILPVISLENVWDIAPVLTYDNLGNSIRSIAFDPTGSYLAAITGGSSAGLDHRLRLWSMRDGQLVTQSEEYGIDTWDLAFSPRGDRVAVGLHDGRLLIYSVPDLTLVKTLSHPGQVNSVAYSPDGMYLAAGVAEAEGGVVYLWNVEQGVLVRRTLAHPYSVPGLAFSPTGQFLATGAVDRAVKVWQLSNGEIVRRLDQAGQGISVAFSPDNQSLASGMCAESTTGLICIDGQVWLWDTQGWGLEQTLTGPIDWVDAVDFSMDGAIVVGGSRDFAIYLWETSSGSMVRSMTGHTGSIQALDFSEDGRLLATGASDERVIVWAVRP